MGGGEGGDVRARRRWCGEERGKERVGREGERRRWGGTGEVREGGEGGREEGERRGWGGRGKEKMGRKERRRRRGR